MNYKKILIIVGIGLAICSTVLIAVYRTTKVKLSVNTVTMQKTNFHESILVSGNLESSNVQNVYKPVAGNEVERIYVKPGDAVQKGEPLVKFKPSNKENFEQVKLEVERAQLNLKVLKNQLNALRYNNSKSRTQPPAKNDDGKTDTPQIPPPAENDDGKTDTPETLTPVEQEEYKQQTNINKLTSSPSSIQEISYNPAMEQSETELIGQIQMAELELKQAKEKLKQTKSLLKDLTIRSEQSGVVIFVNSLAQKEEETDPLITVADLKNLIVTAQVSEYDILKVKENQRAIVRSDALPDKKWVGKVNEIGFIPREANTIEDSQKITYPIKILLDEPPTIKLRSRLLVEIILSEKNVLSLPDEAVVKEGKKDYVFIIRGNRAFKREVIVGKRRKGRIEIISGLNIDEKVIADPPANLKDGVEVTFR
ncbi:efflux RND transporter periplasmic adaptor subunit [Thermoactinomyces mirandus]|uniref:Efflux RND transporter periplasmic adaptor subunit n=1 Tax=Thermoactinomyces mirandus TaxID=2756294 RepID=A0A7W1XV26_9BACL|nr:efflux RND transporter periplasmic adaptor subunit [Thermoactinomyces mirandus]MBA4603587.1 efflux RND transporter periplasmic adaptor subunit [Thermoactinomyces mirandus]